MDLPLMKTELLCPNVIWSVCCKPEPPQPPTHTTTNTHSNYCWLHLSFDHSLWTYFNTCSSMKANCVKGIPQWNQDIYWFFQQLQSQSYAVAAWSSWVLLHASWQHCDVYNAYAYQLVFALCVAVTLGLENEALLSLRQDWPPVSAIFTVTCWSAVTRPHTFGWLYVFGIENNLISHLDYEITIYVTFG